MLRSALRTLLVVSVLAGVAGSVVLLNRPGLSPVGTVPAAPTLTDAELTHADLAQAELIDAIVPAPATIPSAAPPADPVLTERHAAEARKQARKRAERVRQDAGERATRDAVRNPKAAARLMLADRGWSGQFACLDSLWTKESRWNYRASNSSSGAYGIPQALPGGKMSSVGADWRTNPMTQITWGLGYIRDRYGSPCGAWSHSQSSGWY